MTIFFLGTHRPQWLADPRCAGVPLFVSRSTLAGRRGRLITERGRLPRAVTSWALDSGGFTQLRDHGRWTITPEQYVAEVRRCRDEIGRLAWAAPQDWMTEPYITAKTGLAVVDHQRRTVDNYLHLRSLAPDLPFVPVVQGQTLADYETCIHLYERAGVDLTHQHLVGVGSVCRRQATREIQHIVAGLAGLGLRLHGFGVKIAGLARYGPYLASADSLAWSAWGRRTRPGCTSGHASEANCQRFALDWYQRVLAVLERPAQLDLFGGAA